MDNRIKKLLAKQNGHEAEYHAEQIAQNVEQAYKVPAENAIDRKTIAAILAALKATGISIDEKTEREFAEYNEKIEEIKRIVKG